MARRFLIFFGVLTILWGSTVFTADRVASASSTSAPIADFSQQQKTCAVIGIHLNGAHYTATCIHTHMPKRPAGRKHFLSQGPCIPFFSTIQIFNYAYSATLCFEGDGYLGVRIYQVNEFDDTSNGYAWVKWYHQGSQDGHFCTIHPSDAGYWGQSTNVTLTQIDIGSIHSPSDPYCPHR